MYIVVGVLQIEHFLTEIYNIIFFWV